VPKLLMTCNPAKNWTYRDYYKPFKDGKLPPHRKFVQSLVTDNPDIDPSYYQNLLKLDKNSKERLLYGNWEYDDDPASLINFDSIVSLFTNTFVPEGEKYITCDVARFGSDNTVIGEWSGWRCKLYRYKGLKTTEVSEKILMHAKRTSTPKHNIIADEDGVGGGVVDQTGCKGFVNNSSPVQIPGKPPENYNNLKSQCYYKLAERINSNGVYVEVDKAEISDLLTEELEQVKQYKMDADGKKMVVPKDKVKELIGRSPDYSDTLMMREWFELKPKLNYFAL